MANFIYLELDLTAPSNPIIKINDGATFASGDLVTVKITTGDGETAGYQMKIWGAVDTLNDPDIQDSKEASQWISFGDGTRQVKLGSGDGTKQLYATIRDDVFNTSGEVTASIILDSTKPIVTISGQDRTRISEQDQRNVANFSFASDTPFIEYKVMYVTSESANHDTGVIIGTANGSQNTSGTATVESPFDTSIDPIDVKITGTDLKLASGGEGDFVIKVFVKDLGGNWSVA